MAKGASLALNLQSIGTLSELLYLDASVSLFQIMIPRTWRFGSEVACVQFNTVSFGHDAVAPMPRLADFLGPVHLVAKLPALSPGDGDQSSDVAEAAYVNCPVVALAQCISFETQTEQLEHLVPDYVIALAELASSKSARHELAMGHEYHKAASVIAAETDQTYILSIPFSFARAPSVYFMITYSLMTPVQISVKVAPFLSIAWTSQSTSGVPGKPVQKASSTVPTLSLHMYCVFFQISRMERNSILSGPRHVLQTVMKHHRHNTITLQNPANHHNLAFQACDFVRGFFVIVKPTVLNTGVYPQGFEYFNWGGPTPDAKFPIISGYLELDGTQREAAQSGQYACLMASMRNGSLPPRRPYFLLLEGALNTLYGPGAVNMTGVDYSVLKLILAGMPKACQGACDYQVDVQVIMPTFELFIYSGQQFYRAYA